MHSFGEFYSTATGFNLVYGVLINSLFNTGVSLFMLISGYFGVNGSVKKYLKLYLEVLFYSVLSSVIISMITGDWSIKVLIKTFFPVSSNKYWFITSYMLILIFSNYLNKIPEKLEKDEFKKLIFLMFLVFSVVPTVVQCHVMGDDGKGFANMLLMYFIGRYIRLYWNEEPRNPKKTIAIGFGVILLGFCLNLFLTLLRGGKGLYAPFARDYSCIIIIASVAIFIAFKSIKIRSIVINQIANHVVAVYLFEGAMRIFLGQFFDLTMYADKWYLFGAISVYVLVVMAGCMMLDAIRSMLAKPIEEMMCLVGEKSFYYIVAGYEKIWNR